MGAWIETKLGCINKQKHAVAPYVGAWIETLRGYVVMSRRWSHPTWVRGLKQNLIGVETAKASRTLRGCVD